MWIITQKNCWFPLYVQQTMHWYNKCGTVGIDKSRIGAAVITSLDDGSIDVFQLILEIQLVRFFINLSIRKTNYDVIRCYPTTTRHFHPCCNGIFFYFFLNIKRINNFVSRVNFLFWCMPRWWFLVKCLTTIRPRCNVHVKISNLIEWECEVNIDWISNGWDVAVILFWPISLGPEADWGWTWRLFQISLPLEKRRNATSLYNPMTIAELQQKFPKWVNNKYSNPPCNTELL